MKSKLVRAPAVRRMRHWAARLQAGWTPLEAGSLLLLPAEDKDSVLVRLPKPARGHSYLVELDTGEKLSLISPRLGFNWKLHGRHLRDSNVAVVQRMEEESGRHQPLGELEVFRQSEAVLQREHGFTRKNGNLVVGRTTFALKSPRQRQSPQVDMQKEILAHLTQAERRNLRSAFSQHVRPEVPEYRNDGQLVDALSDVLIALYSKLNPSGPSNLVLGIKSPTKLLELIERKKASLQCSRTRDLFLDVVVSLRLLSLDQIRKVEALRYDPIPGIDVNGHSLMDVSSNGEDWFAFDPFARMYFTRENGGLLSSMDIRSMRLADQLAQIRPHVIETSAEPYDMGQMSDIDPHNYNYWCHFNLLRITAVSLPD
ncbi:MAG: hypothetical protein PVI78_04530 [Anaerolineales bacterium]